MSTTEDTTAIDEKKTGESGFKPDFKGFAYNYIYSIVFTIGISIFIIGGLGLYTTKVAQANILPDDIELAPYTVFDRVVNDILIDTNIMRPTFWSDNNETVSQKVKFNSQEYLDSFNNSILCSIKKNAHPNSGLFANAPLFFSIVYDNILANNFLAINTIFFYLSYLPESIIMLVYGFFGIFLWLTLYFFNVCISIFYHFINIPQLFREPANTGFFGGGESDNKKWEATENISFLRFIKLILFFFIWIPIGLFSTFVVPIFFTLYALISPLYASYKIQKSDKANGVTDFIKNNFAYKKFFFFILATISLFSNGIKYLGSNSIIGLIIAVVFAYFMGLYTNEIPQPGYDEFTEKIRQIMKQASIDVSNTNLVEICKPISVVDNKLDSKTSGKQYRTVTKPKNVGGDIDDVYDVSPLLPSAPLPSAPLKQDVYTSTNESQYIPSKTQMQLGGKNLKKKTMHNTKKYNIRLV
jgi:hypothetical protein